MSSVGRQLCHTVVDAASDLRLYANLLEQFGDTAPHGLIVECRYIAEKLEGIVVPTLRFEGEQPRELVRGAS